MKKSFIERIFPHSPGNTSALPRYEDGFSDSLSQSAASPPRITLQDSLTTSPSPSQRRNPSLSSSALPQSTRSLSSTLVRHNDPFIPVERAAMNLERTFQGLLDAQSEGLAAGGIGGRDRDDLSSVGSPTPTPSLVATSPRSIVSAGPKTMPIRQPRPKRTTLHGARRGLEKSMREFAALKEWELSLIDQEVVSRDTALKQASDLGNRREMLEDEIHKIKSAEGPVGLKSEVQAVELEIQQLEVTLMELKSKHRILRSQLHEVESSKDSEISSYTEALALNERQVKAFLRRPPILQSLKAGQDPGMYALKPERRTLQMAQEQWTGEIESLGQRKASVESEKDALEEGSRLWHDVVWRIKDFERDLKSQTTKLAVQSQSKVRSSVNGEGYNQESSSTMAEEVSMHRVLTKMAALISSLEHDLQHAESKHWNLLVCAIGAEVAAFEQARDLFRETADITASDDTSQGGTSGDLFKDDQHLVDDEEGQEDQPTTDLLIEGQPLDKGTRSPGGSSNHSLEDTLREFGNHLDKGKQKADGGNAGGVEPDRLGDLEQIQHRRHLQPDLLYSDRGLDPAPATALPAAPASARPEPPGRTTTSESEDDEPGPEFLLSHS